MPRSIVFGFTPCVEAADMLRIANVNDDTEMARPLRQAARGRREIMESMTAVIFLARIGNDREKLDERRRQQDRINRKFNEDQSI